MTRSLQDRIRTAHQPGARLADIRTLKAEAELALPLLRQAKASADERRADPNLTADQIIDAQLDCQEIEISIVRLELAIPRLANLEVSKIAGTHERHRIKVETMLIRRAFQEIAAVAETVMNEAA